MNSSWRHKPSRSTSAEIEDVDDLLMWWWMSSFGWMWCLNWHSHNISGYFSSKMFGPGFLLRKAMQLTTSPGLILPSTHWISDLKTVRFLTSAAWGQGPTSYAALKYQDSKDFSTSHNGVIFQRCLPTDQKNENWKSIFKGQRMALWCKVAYVAICKKLRGKLLFTFFLLKKTGGRDRSFTTERTMKHLNSLRLPSLGRRVLPFPRNTHWKMCEALVRNGQGYRSKARYQVFFAWMELVQDRLLLLFLVGSQKKKLCFEVAQYRRKDCKTCHMPTLSTKLLNAPSIGSLHLVSQSENICDQD